MRIILFGTGPFAVPAFQSLIDSSHEILLLVTRPIANAGNRRKSAENPTRDLAVQMGVPVVEPASCNQDEFVAHLKSLEADLFVVCDYGQILSRDCLGAARLGGINLHGSLLPKYRGAAPINWAIYHGESETGVTIIHMTPKLDGGPCLAQASTAIGPNETTEQIEPRLAQLGVGPVMQAIEMLENWDGSSKIGTLQDPKLATKAPRLKKSDGRMDWHKSAQQIANQVRAFQPWPGSFTEWSPSTNKPPIRLIILDVETAPNQSDEPDREPGQIVQCNQECLIVQAGEGCLSIKRLQPAGKRPMSIAEFLRGRQPKIGDQLK